MRHRQVFISYAHQDYPFVPLCAKLLEAHGLEPWFSHASLCGGDLFASKIDEQLAGSDVLIVVVSRHTVGSSWVTTELASFRAKRPDAPVIPVVLEKVDLKRVGPDLPRFHAVDFTGDQLTGFQQLLEALGHDFMSRSELANRRAGSDRRRGAERRTSNIRQRVSLGLLIAYTRRTGDAVADTRAMSAADLAMLREPLTEELERYEFTETKSRLGATVTCVVQAAMSHAAGRVAGRKRTDVVELLRELATFVCDRYEVVMIDRRQGKRRSHKPD